MEGGTGELPLTVMASAYPADEGEDEEDEGEGEEEEGADEEEEGEDEEDEGADEEEEEEEAIRSALL